MSWSAFQLVPDDLLFFRDGKPSTRGNDHYLRSLFPPHPATLYGALRTRRLADGNVDLSGLNGRTWAGRVGEVLAAEVGAWGGFGSLELRGPWLVRDGEPLLPAPLDLGLLFGPAPSTRESAPISAVVRFLPSLGNSERRWSHPLALLKPFQRRDKSDGRWASWEPPAAGIEPASTSGWFLRPAGFAAWSAGSTPDPEHFVRASDLWVDEARTGVGLQAGTRTSETGQLYTFGFIRLRQGVALGFEVRGSALQVGGRVRLGGEGRTALLETGPVFPAFPALPAPALEAGGDLIALALASPSISNSGSWPPGFSATNLDGILHGDRFRLVAAAVPGLVPIGGWDLANGRSKPLRRAIPAGSVFFLQPEEGAAGAARSLHGKPLTDTQDALDKQGFGLAVAGVCSGG